MLGFLAKPLILMLTQESQNPELLILLSLRQPAQGPVLRYLARSWLALYSLLYSRSWQAVVQYL